MSRFICLYLLLFFACNPDRVPYSDALKREMADQKIKRVTPGQLLETVDSWGLKITTLAQNELTAKLNVGGSRNLCSLTELPKTQALAKRYGFQISLLGAADSTNRKLAQKEREVLAAYRYNADRQLPQQSNIQIVNDTLYVYNAPVPPANPICQTCFDAGNALAVWRLAFPKREVIRHINVKK